MNQVLAIVTKTLINLFSVSPLAGGLSGSSSRTSSRGAGGGGPMSAPVVIERKVEKEVV